MEDQQIIEAIENIRRDKHQPLRYLFFTFLNGLAQGLGMALGMTLFLGIVVYVLTVIVANMINFPVIGHYFDGIGQLIDAYAKSAPKIH
ncbi:MAG TPA: DUF5665 domain-containing protein [Candidatus Omnitrophota bacterium]|nr:DUF5665 domain-containing protein [Candidatus Omnitrophota bacterium]